MTDPLEYARRAYAEELKYSAGVESPAVVEAFARVPRERFLGPGPWRLISPMRMGGYWTTPDAAPERLYHDVLVAIDEERGLNNGQPSLWAALYDQLGLARGERVVHVGTGTGYYTAIMAEIVGPTGAVMGVEVDAGLAARARDNLALAWPQARVVAGDGFAFRPERLVDAVVINAGASHLSLAWLDALAEGGRLLVPLTGSDRWGGYLMVTRLAGPARGYGARYVSRTGIIPCVGGRDAGAEAKLKEALQRAPFDAVRSLRRAPEEPPETSWHAREGGWV